VAGRRGSDDEVEAGLAADHLGTVLDGLVAEGDVAAAVDSAVVAKTAFEHQGRLGAGVPVYRHARAGLGADQADLLGRETTR
jgi:hypothetical protein